MSKADDLKARAAQIAARRRTSSGASGTGEISSRKISLTVQLQEGLYRGLKAWPSEAGLPAALGRASVPTVEVMRALVEELLSSDELQELIQKRISKNLK